MVILSTALPARADVGMQIVINGSTVFNSTATGQAISTSTPLTVAGSGITIQTSSATSNSPGNDAVSTTNGSTVALESAANSAAATITVLYSSNSFTAPTAGTLASQLGGTLNTAFGTGATLLSFQSWANTSNALFAMTNPFTTGVQTANLATLGLGAFTVSPNPATLDGVSLPSLYSTTSRVTLAIPAQGGTVGNIGWQASTNILGTSVIPEPASIVMISTGLPLLGLGAWLRKRGNKV